MATLEELIVSAKARVAAMTPMEYDAMIAAQKASFVRAEMMWPKPKFKDVNGVRVYDSYEDYCNS